jgi:hypothetical protein
MSVRIDVLSERKNGFLLMFMLMSLEFAVNLISKPVSEIIVCCGVALEMDGQFILS